MQCHDLLTASYGGLQVMIKSLRSLGITIEDNGDDSVIVHGSEARFTVFNRKVNGKQEDQSLFFANAGTASRFMTSAMTLLPPNSAVILDGNARMRERPIGKGQAMFVFHLNVWLWF